jgi:hypothetical protein
MFSVFFTNFGYTLDREFATIDSAIQAGRESGFEFKVIKKEGSHTHLVGHFTIFGGYRALQYV